MTNDQAVTGQTVRSLKYFWEEKGDLERWTGWDTATDIPHDVRQAWANYVLARRMVDMVISQLEDTGLGD